MNAARGLLAAALAVSLLTGAAPVAAEGGTGASSRVIGRGDIVTSILRPAARSASTKPIDPSRCRWITFDDAQTEFLVAIAASVRGSAPTGALVDELAALLDHEDDPDLLADAEVQGRRCDGAIGEFRLQPRVAVEGISATQLGRRMITRLPAPVLTVSPPLGSEVPVSQPVFVSVAAEHWRPVTAELSDGDLVAEVRATPIALRTFTGVPGADFHTCAGRGRRFDPTVATTPAVQATADGACTMTYTAANHAAGDRALPGRPATWIGTVTVLWSAEWRIAPGPWRSLGVIPRTRIVERTVGELATSIERASG